MTILERMKNIPLYQDILSRLREGDDENAWLESLPPLEKRSLVKNFPVNLMSPELKKALENNLIEYNSTSGTTDDRLQIMRKIDWWEEEEERIAPYTRSWGKYLRDPTYSRAVLTTPMCSSTVCYRDNPSYETRIIGNKLYLNTAVSPDVWSQNDVRRMVDEIDRFRPMHFHADPIYLAFFVYLLRRYQVKAPQWIPQFLTLSFEFAPLLCRKFIRSFWDIQTFSLYGLTELGYLFCECEEGNLHWCEPLNKLHFIPFRNKENVFNLAVTSFKNEYMPFVKYITNDLFLWDRSRHSSCSCGHPSPVFVDKILGRQKDVTMSQGGVPFTVGEVDQILADLSLPIFLYQLDFTISGRLVFKYLSIDSNCLNASQENLVQKALQEIYGDKIGVEVIHAVSIKPASSGKFCLIKQA